MLFETFEDSATAPLHVAAESVDVVPARLVYPANLRLNVGDVLPARFRQLLFVLLEAPVPPTAADWHILAILLDVGPTGIGTFLPTRHACRRKTDHRHRHHQNRLLDHLQLSVIEKRRDLQRQLLGHRFVHEAHRLGHFLQARDGRRVG